MKSFLHKVLFALAVCAGMTFAIPQKAKASDGYIVVKNTKTGQTHCYELNCGGWVRRVGTYVLWSGDEGKTWYIIDY